MRTVKLPSGGTWPMREIHRRYLEQRAEERRKAQLLLFELKEDARPVTQRDASGRYQQPLLFEK